MASFLPTRMDMAKIVRRVSRSGFSLHPWLVSSTFDTIHRGTTNGSERPHFVMGRGSRIGSKQPLHGVAETIAASADGRYWIWYDGQRVHRLSVEGTKLAYDDYYWGDLSESDEAY